MDAQPYNAIQLSIEVAHVWWMSAMRGRSRGAADRYHGQEEASEEWPSPTLMSSCPGDVVEVILVFNHHTMCVATTPKAIINRIF